MKNLVFVMMFFLSWMCLVRVEGLAVANEADDDLHENSLVNEKVTQTDEDKVLEIKKQVLLLQESVAEITRSFSTLELVVKNPSVMSKLHLPEDIVIGKARHRRDVDSPSTLPSSFPPSRSSADTPNTSNWAPPYSWPMFSGQCFLCPAGVPGPRGPPGPQGMTGRDGRDGRDAALSPEMTERLTLPNEEEEPVPVIQVMNTNVSALPGVVYTRWGHNECPEGAELIYSGSIGGAHYSHAGSGSNHLCMPDEPIYDEIEVSAHADRSLLYSSEYQTANAVPRLIPRHDHTPTCAVCRAPSGRTTKVMIPARNVCPSDEWRLEYAGYLMATHYAHKRSEFVCVDREMIAKAGTTGNQDGALLYMVEGRCLVGGGLDCGPYVDGAELTCALCTL